MEADEAGRLSTEGEWRETEMGLRLPLGLEGEAPKPKFKKELKGGGGEPRNLDLPTSHLLLDGAAAATEAASIGFV